MNYQHIFHAGNFADVFKHILLIDLMDKICAKETPFCVIESHAGRGVYDLNSNNAQKTRECETGIKKLMDQADKHPLFKSYLDIVARLNEQKHALGVRWYPGSPYIISKWMRSFDRLQLCELHPKEFDELKELFFYKKNVSLFLANGYERLNALVPPRERRGLILMDPPYESPNEFDHIYDALTKAHRKFPTGVYAIWYPIKSRYPIQQFHEFFKEAGYKNTLAAEFLIHPCNEPNRLNGCGMIIVNTPWQFEIGLQQWMPVLLKALNFQQTGQVSVEWLVRVE